MDGTVTGVDNKSLVEKLCEEHALFPVSEEYDSRATEKPDGLIISISRDGVSNEAIDNLKRLIASKKTLILKAVVADNVDVEVEANAISFPWWDMLPCFENITT